MPREPNNKKHSWDQIAQQINQEKDPCNVLALAKKLNEAMLTEEREKAQRRLGITATPRPLAPWPVGTPTGPQFAVYSGAWGEHWLRDMINRIEGETARANSLGEVRAASSLSWKWQRLSRSERRRPCLANASVNLPIPATAPRAHCTEAD
jgi:hypothetical protein